MRKVIFFVLILFFIPSVFATLGISPAKKSFDFSPGKVIQLDYTAISENSEREIEIYAEGDLAQYVTFDKKTLNGGGSFHATISLPAEVEVPGGYRLLIGLREKPLEGQFLGVAINIRSVVDIFVPYPGRYVSIDLKVPNGNVDEIIPIDIHLVNQGKESLDIESSLIVSSASGENVLNRNFDSLFLASTEDHYFRTFLNTTDVRPGSYIAKVSANYGDVVNINATFNVGSLFVNITNFTTFLPKDNIQKFFINIESRWNGILQEVYGEVNVSNQTFNTLFRTPSVNLGAWEKNELVGYADTSSLMGEYSTDVEVFYAGHSTQTSGKLSVNEISEIDLTKLIWIGAVIVSLIIVGAVLLVLMKKRKKRR